MSEKYYSNEELELIVDLVQEITSGNHNLDMALNIAIGVYIENRLEKGLSVDDKLYKLLKETQNELFKV